MSFAGCATPPPRRAIGRRTASLARATGALSDLLEDDDLDAVVLATPVPSHASLAIAVAQAGKHCFVEKPLATTAADAERAVEAATSAGKILMVGHLLEYHPAVGRLKELIDGGELGTLYYVYGNRLNLGKLRADENALWSLGAHDVSVVLHLIGEEPEECLARRAPADRVRALHRVHPQRIHAALGRQQRAARGARAGGAPALARRI